MKIAINQPTYLPWLGYFDLIDQVDLFVVLDNVQFSKQSWQQRNRIKTAAGFQWLTVPVNFRGRLGQLICDIEIRDPEFWRNHVRAIELAYARSPHLGCYFPALRERLEAMSRGLLVDLNLNLLSWLLEVLGIRTPIVPASALGQSGRRTELLANICAAQRATTYVSPIGSAAYLLDEYALLQQRGTNVLFQNYEHPVYRQLFGSFTPFASVIDLLFNEGEQALKIIRSGRRECLSTGQVSSLVMTA